MQQNMGEQILDDEILEIPVPKQQLKNFLNNLPESPGVYKFFDGLHIPIYIGKAKNIKKRVSSYFQSSRDSFKKVKKLIDYSKFIEITLTNNELEALLLEQHLIKECRPKYNVQFKDDKGYPLIKLDVSEKFPSAKIYLGKKEGKAKYFGPYPNSYAVKDTLNLIQKTFRIRNCSESFFKNRTRPCLQHEIGRCSAPCVGLVSNFDYMKEVESTELLLLGKSNKLINQFYKRMDKYSDDKKYEKAASYRDKLSALRDIQRMQSISGFSKQRDAIFVSTINGQTKIGVTHVNEGWVIGHENFIQKQPHLHDNVIESFIKIHYLKEVNCPSFLVLEEGLKDKSLLEDALSHFHKKRVKIISKPGKKDKGLIEICKSNTIYSLNKKLKNNDASQAIQSLIDTFNIPNKIGLIESYDISHHSGSEAVAGCVVYSDKGKLRDKYRLFSISSENSGNDIASLCEAIERRFSNKDLGLKFPSLIIIDGGRSHLSHVSETLKRLKIKDILTIAISKGSNRKAEMDSIHLPDGSSISISKGSLAHLFIQEIRDETHRFSISTQKKKIIKHSMTSNLDDLKGIGPTRKKALVRHFGSVEQIKRASLQDLIQVPGLGKKTATSINKQLK